ncbi:MAG: hypothetical protein ACI4LX_03890 [Treponema sp.]
MSKKELLAEYITSDLISYLMEDEKISMVEAMQKLYSSETFEKINDFETGLYLESSPYVYDLFKAEMTNGKLVQLEI